MTDTERRFLSAASLLSALVLAAFFWALPTGLAGAAPAAGEGASSFEERCGGLLRSSSTSVERSGGRYDIHVKRGRCRLDVQIDDGGVEFLPDESGVASIERGARLEITERVGRDERRIVVTPGAGGEPVYAWWVDGRAADFDADGRAWFAGILPEVFRTTGIDAEARVGRLLERGGVDGVLHEVTLISSDHVQRVYLEQLLSQAEPDGAQFEEVLDLAGHEVGSDFELAEFLIGTSRDVDAEALQVAYARSAHEIGSDFELRRALAALVDRRDLGDEALDAVLRSARGIGSDFELAELLIKVAGVAPADGPLPASYVDAVAGIGSDFEHRRALMAVVDREPLDRETLDQALGTAADIGSDFELAELLVRLAKVYPRGEQLPTSFFEATDTIGSDFELRRTLKAVVDRGDLTPDTVEAILESALEVGSDFEMAELLLALARSHAIRDPEEPALRRALESVGSKFERNRVLAELGIRRLD